MRLQKPKSVVKAGVAQLRILPYSKAVVAEHSYSFRHFIGYVVVSIWMQYFLNQTLRKIQPIIKGDPKTEVLCHSRYDRVKTCSSSMVLCVSSLEVDQSSFHCKYFLLPRQKALQTLGFFIEISVNTFQPIFWSVS